MIDSQVKRASVLGIVQPDAGIDQGDRQTLLGIYRGILAGALLVYAGDLYELAVTWGQALEMSGSWGQELEIAGAWSSPMEIPVKWEAQ